MDNPDLSVSFQKVDNSDATFLIKFLEDAASFPSVKKCFECQLDWMDIRPGQHILDVGCGIGDQALAIAKRTGPTGRVVGTDISQTMVDVSKVRHSNSGLPLEFIVAQATAQPFPDGSFDCIRMERVLMYIIDVDTVMREFNRLLKPNGRLLIYDMLWDGLTFDHPDKALTRRIVHHIADSFPSGRAGAHLWQLFANHGFNQLKTKQYGYMVPDAGFPRRVVEGITRSGIPDVFTKEEIDGFWDQLEEDGRTGRFFCVFPGVVVTGVKG